MTFFSGTQQPYFKSDFRRGNNNEELEGYRPNDEDFEAIEDDNVIVDDIQDDRDGDSEDEVEGDDLMDNMEADYEANPVLDNYENVGIDEDDQHELSMNQRMEVDQRLDQQDRLQKLGRRPGALIDEEYDEDDEMLHNQMRQERLRMMREGGPDQGMQDSQDNDAVLDLEDVRGPLFVWLKK